MSSKEFRSLVKFGFADAKTRVYKTREIKQLIVKMFREHNLHLQSLQYVFCTDEYLLQLNQQFLDHDTYTDIITFTLSEEGQPTEGEIYISIDRVRENAIAHSSSYSMELARVIFHGALHLCGHRDKNKVQQAKMRAKEEEFLSRLL